MVYLGQGEKVLLLYLVLYWHQQFTYHYGDWAYVRNTFFFVFCLIKFLTLKFCPVTAVQPSHDTIRDIKYHSLSYMSNILYLSVLESMPLIFLLVFNLNCRLQLSYNIFFAVPAVLSFIVTAGSGVAQVRVNATISIPWFETNSAFRCYIRCHFMSSRLEGVLRHSRYYSLSPAFLWYLDLYVTSA